MDKGLLKHQILKEDLDLVTLVLHECDVNVHSREIFLHSYYQDDVDTGDESGMDYKMASTFVKNMSLLNNQGRENILVHQQSCGGDWDYGMSIYDSIASSRSPVTMLAYAHAYSMSSITLQAATLRVLTPSCNVLIHQGSLEFSDRVTPIVSSMRHWEKYEKPRMLDIYTRRCKNGRFFKNKKMSRKRVKAFILTKMQENTDWILTAEEAVYYGFADGILGSGSFKTLEDIRR